MPVSTGKASWKWVVANEDDNADAELGLSTSDLVVTDDGSFYIADGSSSRVVILDSLGKVREMIGRRGAGPGEFSDPSAIALDADHRLYVGDLNGRITVLSPTGTYIRTIQIPEFVNAPVTGIRPLPGGTIAVSVDARPREARGAYVKIIDSVGATVRDVLMLPSPKTAPDRPLLAHELNLVRLAPAATPSGFAVWYPTDNLVQLFDVAGQLQHVVEGCLSERIQASYAAQRARGSSRQSLVILTLGIHVDSPTEVRIASYDWKKSGQTLRLRRYSVGRGEVAARDYNISDPERSYDRVAFTRKGILMFRTGIREYGIRRYTVDWDGTGKIPPSVDR